MMHSLRMMRCTAVALVMWLSLAQKAVSQDPSCLHPSGSTPSRPSFHVDGSCVHYMSTPSPWPQANHSCVEQGGMLYTPHTAERQSLLESSLSSDPLEGDVWVGGYRQLGPQASIWSWQSACQNCPATTLQQACSTAGLDLTFILDESSYTNTPQGVTHTYFNEIKDYVISLLSNLDLGRGVTQTSVAVVRYARYANVEFHLDRHDNRQDIEAAISRMVKSNNGAYLRESNIAVALDTLRSDVYTRATNRPANPDVVVLINAGRPTVDIDYTRTSAGEVKSAGIAIYVVGINERPSTMDRELLEDISSSPHIYTTTYWIYDRFSSLYSRASSRLSSVLHTQQLLGRLCGVERLRRSDVTDVDLMTVDATFAPKETREQGCYQDSAQSSDIDTLVVGETDPLSNSMTPELCLQLCDDYGVAATQDGRMCWCGETFGNRGNTVTDLCTVPCTGNSSMVCGGTSRNTVYLTNATGYGSWLLRYSLPEPAASHCAYISSDLQGDSRFFLAPAKCTTRYAYICEVPMSACFIEHNSHTYTTYRQSCYYVSDIARSWDYSRYQCRSMGGDLLSLDSLEEHQFIRLYLESNSNYLHRWVALRKQNLVWARPGDSQDYTSLTFTKFFATQPDLQSGGCLRVEGTAEGYWYDDFCEGAGMYYNYYCEIEQPTTVATTQTTSPSTTASTQPTSSSSSSSTRRSTTVSSSTTAADKLHISFVTTEQTASIESSYTTPTSDSGGAITEPNIGASTDNSSSLDTWYLVLIILLVLLVIFIVILLICCIVYYRKYKNNHQVTPHITQSPRRDAYDARQTAPLPDTGPLGDRIYIEPDYTSQSNLVVHSSRRDESEAGRGKWRKTRIVIQDE